MTSPNHTVPILVSTGLTYDLDTLKKRKHSSTSSRLDCEMWNIQTSVILNFFRGRYLLRKEKESEIKAIHYVVHISLIL